MFHVDHDIDRVAEFIVNVPEGFISMVPRVVVALDDPRVDFQRVSFSYAPEKPVFKQVGFELTRGVTALVGASGCGKTTSLNLLLKLYEPSAGVICVNGHCLSDMDLSSFKGQAGVVLQEPFLWNDTVANNIRYEEPRMGMEEVYRVARLTGVDGFVDGLPGGYGAVIGDEAMSSMDACAEEKVMVGIRQQRDIAMVLVVAHRLSTVLACDRVCYFKSPAEVLTGSFQGLLQEPSFHELFAAQMKEHGQG